MAAPKSNAYDAVVVGSGPNGLAAAIAVARAGCSVLLLEGKETIGGGLRSAELTLPGFVHDVCAAIHALGCTSPFYKELPLQDYGLEWIAPPISLAHPLDDGSAVFADRSLETTSESLGRDGKAYWRLLAPIVHNWHNLAEDLLGPLPLPPRHPIILTQFGLRALWPAYTLAKALFKEERAQALFGGMAAHSILPLDKVVTSAFGTMLNASAHAVGWPVAKGGSQKMADALAAHLRSLGGEIETGRMVQSLDELPPAKAVFLDITPRQFLSMAGERLPAVYRRKLERYRYGPGVFKLDLALDGPIPWTADSCQCTATVHLGGRLEEIARSEREVWQGKHPEKPFVLISQQSLYDPGRAPAGKHTAWAYCHVPHGSTFDMTERIEAQIERFAPGFRDCVLARNGYTAVQMEQYNPNYVGGDINGGVQDLAQHFTRPVARWVPYSTPLRGVYLCSSATPPGGGTHGMCGYHAAQAALRKVL